MKESSPAPTRGKILRIKAGFNPNSSSVGSQIPIFFAYALATGSLTIIVLNLMAVYDRLIRPPKGNPYHDGNEDC